MSNILNSFINYNDHSYGYEYKDEIANQHIIIRNYLLYSQKWPIHEEKTIPTTIWSHNLILYIPRNLEHKKAFIFVNGGSRINSLGEDDPYIPKENLNFTKIATFNQALVINLQNNPNQYLFMNNTYKKEDAIIAYTYKLFMSDPDKNSFLPAHLPMAKAIVKAMDASTEIIQNDFNFEIDNFILSGISKRGWAAWLTAIEDKRVSAIIPINIDILNVQKSISYICNFYKDGCPQALDDYKNEGIIPHINSNNFTLLMNIEDPLSYLGDDYDPKYKKHFEIDKYIINSSGDDFFTPDSSKHYFKLLPGQNNYIRYLPNSFHYLKGNIIADSTSNMEKVEAAINNYLYFHLNQIRLPQVNFEMSNAQIKVSTSQIPTKVILWSCNNEQDKDFRLLSSYSNMHLFSKKILSFFSPNLGDRYYNQNEISFFSSKLNDKCYDQNDSKFTCLKSDSCQIKANLPDFTNGWQASFLELTFNINNYEFIITSEVNILGKENTD